MTKIQRKALHSSLALILLGSAYALIFKVPIYKLDFLSILFISLIVSSILGIVWSYSE